jgi:glucosamine--fructose-6-phosphate aminotransferase (isomerizing)
MPSLPSLYEELVQQPQALRELAAFYQANPTLLDLPGGGGPRPWVLTGMGASYHAAWIGMLHLNRRGIPAVAIEATDLVNYAAALRENAGPLVYVSQSGSSGEVFSLLDVLDSGAPLVAITNEPASPLAQRAARVLPLAAGEENWIAGKTYLNALALLWLLAGRATGQDLPAAYASLNELADRAVAILAGPGRSAGPLAELLDPSRPLLFVGHGPHAVTARQAAMTLGEWPKVVACSHGVGAYRHGFIETIRPGSSVVAFAAPGLTAASTLSLAAELEGYGARVLLIEHGLLRRLGDPPPAAALDEFLSPLLDILPIQLSADKLANAAPQPPGFRHISKVVRKV